MTDIVAKNATLGLHRFSIFTYKMLMENYMYQKKIFLLLQTKLLNLFSSKMMITKDKLVH